MHLLFTVITLGLWLVPWIAVCIAQVMRPWRCEHCGWHKPVFRNPSRFQHVTLTQAQDAQLSRELQHSHPHA
jgi:hypothetical protein